MSDNAIPMPEGLTPIDIPISNSIEELVQSTKDLTIFLEDDAKQKDKKQKEQVTNTTQLVNKISKEFGTIEEVISKDGIKVTPSEKAKKEDEKIKKNNEKKLKEKDEKDKSKQGKFFEGISEHFNKVTDKMGGVASNLYDNIMPNILGPLNLITQPLGELTGIDPLGSMKEGIKGLFGKKSSKKPSAEEVAKGGFLGAGFLYMSNMMEKWFGKKKGSEEGLGGLLSKLPAGLGGILAKAGGIGAILGSITWMIADGIKGMKLSDVWETSKIGAVIGAVIGGTDKGLKGMFKGMGKWALMGAGIGTLIMPGVGTLIGGLLGTAFGGIAGYFGGEKIAKIMDKFGNFFNSIGEDFVRNFKDGFNLFELISGVFTSINESDLVAEIKAKFPIVEKIGELASMFFSPFINAWKAVFEGLDFMEIWKADSSIMSKIGATIRDIAFAWLDGLKAMFTNVGENFSKIWESVTSEGVVGSVKDFFGGVGGDIKEGASDFFGGLFGKEENVQDAIITKTGEIIHTSPDDNIIATKNDPTQIVSVSEKIKNEINEIVSISDMMRKDTNEIAPISDMMRKDINTTNDKINPPSINIKIPDFNKEIINNNETMKSIIEIPDFNKETNVTIESNEIVTLLQKLVDIIKEKPMGNTIIENTKSNNFESLRLLGVQ